MPIIKDEDGAPIFVSEDSEEFKINQFHRDQDIAIEQKVYKSNNNKKMKTSKVKNVQPNGDFKDMKIFEIVFENGDVGNNYAKGQCKFEIGKEYEYDITGTSKNPTIKFIGEVRYAPKSFGGNGGGYQKSPQDKVEIARSVALKAAVDAIGVGEEEYKYVNYALYFEHYLTTGQQLQQDAMDNELSNRKMDANDELPF